MTGVHLVTNSPALRRAVRDAFAPTPVRARGARPGSVPTRADAVVTTGRLTSSLERYAARLGTPYVVVLPEGAAYLEQFVADRDGPDGVVLVGSDVGDPDHLHKHDHDGADEEVEL